MDSRWYLETHWQCRIVKHERNQAKALTERIAAEDKYRGLDCQVKQSSHVDKRMWLERKGIEA